MLFAFFNGDSLAVGLGPIGDYIKPNVITMENLRYFMAHNDLAFDSFKILKEYYFANIDNLDPEILQDLIDKVNEDIKADFAINGPRTWKEHVNKMMTGNKNSSEFSITEKLKEMRKFSKKEK